MKLLYRPLSLLISVAGGILASAVFKRIWRAISGEDEAPQATSSQYHTREVLTAAVLQGAVYAGVKAAVDRVGAKGYHRLTGKHLDE